MHHQVRKVKIKDTFVQHQNLPRDLCCRRLLIMVPSLHPSVA